MVESLSASFETSLPVYEVLWRMGLACGLGFVIGFDREFRGHPAGLRTNMLTALAASAFAIIAIEMIADLSAMDDNTRFDPIRVVEAVTAGVAFLGAGTIIYAQGSVKGLTTGASMWLSGAVGLACGAGYLTVALIAAAFAMVILVAVGAVETFWLDRISKDRSSDKR